jgi:hypothetical protein
MKGYVILGKLDKFAEVIDVLLVTLVISDTITGFVVLIPDMNVIEEVIVVIPAGGVNWGVVTISGLASRRLTPNTNIHIGLDNAF